MNENENKKEDLITVPYIVWESDRARAERIIVRLIGVIILLVICFTAYVAYDKWQESQYEYEDVITETVDVDGENGGNANYNRIENGGEIINGTSESNKDTPQD